MDWSLLLVPGVSLGRGILGWLENAMSDGKIDFPEFGKLGETVIRMGVPMVALIWGLNVTPEVAAGAVTVFDIAFVKVTNAIKSKKK
jgi:hypothetical protein